MVTSKYKVSDLGLTLKVKFREFLFVSLQYKLKKDISDCLICYFIRPGATIELADTKSNKYVSNYIDYFPTSPPSISGQL